ncbi:MAG: hypothetical protein MZV65_07255 [Chromatiales bacterium]|nr:hypothetical protein [Chromatiales bacterium]
MLRPVMNLQQGLDVLQIDHDPQTLHMPFQPARNEPIQLHLIDAVGSPP